MKWQKDEEGDNDTKEWPTVSSRLNWARNNYRRSNLTIQQQLQKLLILTMNVIAMDDLIEEETGESYIKARQKKEWKEWYQSFRPTQSVGRPKKN